MRSSLRAATAAAALALHGCSETAALTLLPGVVNDPGNVDLRRAILGFATGRICEEMKSRSVPLRFRADDPALGRFYPSGCFVQDLPNQHLLVQFAGLGFGWSNVTKRLGFEASANVEYELDFAVDGDVMYVYFKAVSVTSARFVTRYVERDLSQVGVLLPGGSPQAAADQLGLALLRTELSRGFTVMRDGKQNVSFGLGQTPRGARPTMVFKGAAGRTLVANERVEVHEGQRDYIGPLALDGDAALSVAVEGAPGVDVMLFAKQNADPWLASYLSQPVLGPPYAAPILDEPVMTGPVWQRKVKVPRGTYYLVVDNTAVAGRVAPPGVQGDDRAAMVSVAVED